MSPDRPLRGGWCRPGGWLAGLALALLLMTTGQAVPAQERPAGAQPAPQALPSAVVIVVDFDAVLRESEAFASIEAHVEGLRASLQQEFIAIEDELRALEQQILEERGRLSEEEFVVQRRTFEQRVTSAQRDAQNRRLELQRIHEEAVGQVRVALLQVIAGIAREAGASLVLNQNQVILADYSLDFTDEALEQLNSVLPRTEFSGLPLFDTSGSLPAPPQR